MKRTILFVGGGIEAVPGILRAKAMGLHVVVSDGDPTAPGLTTADDHLVVSTYDVEGSVRAARDFHRSVRPLHGVICVAADVPVTVACIAEALGLPGIPPEVARLTTDKLAMKERFASDGIPVPWFRSVTSVSDLKSVVRERGCPLVVKPVDSRGARGVIRLTENVDPEWAFLIARRHSPTDRVMVERFLPGPQVSTESLVVGGMVFTVGFSDRNYEYLERFAPFIIENGGELPSFLPDCVRREIDEVLQSTARSLGMDQGVLKGDIVVSGGEVYVIEVASRLSGGYFCTHEIPLNTGVDFVGHAIRMALGENLKPSELVPNRNIGVAQRYLFPEPGRVRLVEGVEEVFQRPWIELCEVRVRPGDLVRPPENHPSRAGVVIAVGKDREEAVLRAVEAVESIRIETVPVDLSKN